MLTILAHDEDQVDLGDYFESVSEQVQDAHKDKLA